MISAIAIIVIGVKIDSTAVLVLGIISTVCNVIYKIYKNENN